MKDLKYNLCLKVRGLIGLEISNLITIVPAWWRHSLTRINLAYELQKILIYFR